MVEGNKHMTVTPDNYLNIGGILINEVIGSVILFLLIGIAVIAYICVVNGVSTKNTVAALSVFVLISLTAYYSSFILAIVLLAVGFMGYSAYNRYMNKQ
jgi:hypothetical protein